MIFAFALLFLVYFFSMMSLVYGFKKIPIFSAENSAPTKTFTVVIPFRNEAENLPNLLRSISELNYPTHLFEIIFVNDASEDRSEEIVSEANEKSRFSIKLIQNKRVSNSPKKDAISEAIKNSKFEWITTTDADCQLQKNWLKTLDAFIKKNNAVLIAGPIFYNSNGTTIENFQQFDGFSLQTVTIGSFGFKNPILSNGANLAYKKNAFFEVNGFSDNNHIASGDDIFLLEKIKKEFPQHVKFLKSAEAIVYTLPQKTWKNVINQRIRWASKTSKQRNFLSIFLGILMVAVNFSMLAIPFLMVLNPHNLSVYIPLIFFKIITDFFVVRQSADFFGKKVSFWSFLWQTFLYSAIVIVVIMGSVRGSYVWKGRIHKNP